jgi:Mu transposase, C-terminal
VIGFLPVIHRKLQRNGLYFERIRYWADVLPATAQPSRAGRATAGRRQGAKAQAIEK